MMALLPPTGWGDVATRRDLEAHELVTKRQLEALEPLVLPSCNVLLDV